MTPGRWVLATCSAALLILFIVLAASGSKIGLIYGLILVVSVLVIWRGARPVRAKQDLNNRG